VFTTWAEALGAEFVALDEESRRKIERFLKVEG
jgi:hypothetical protein